MKTKKVGMAGRFGSKYGKKVRVNFVGVGNLRKTKWACPSCMKNTVKRESAGVWQCSKCGHKYAGKAYKPI